MSWAVDTVSVFRLTSYWNFLTYFLQLWMAVFSSNSVITYPPVDTVGCFDGISELLCRMDSNNIIKVTWSVQGNLINEDIKQYRGITTHSVIVNGSETSRLYISGWPINSGIIVSCKVFLTVYPHILTKGVMFTVTDPPPVYNVTATATGTDGITIINWNPPHCVSVNSSYFVTVESTASFDTVTHVTDNLNLTINTSLCVSYNISVQVRSHEYKSSITRILYENPNDIKSIIVNELVMEFLNKNYVLGNLIGKIKGEFCYEEIVIQSTVYKRFYQSPSNVTQTISTVTFQNNNYKPEEIQFKHVIGPFDQQLMGTVEIISSNIQSTNLSFITFHVQDLTTSVLNETLTVSCNLGKNSSADGCLIAVAIDGEPPYMNLTLYRGSEEQVLIPLPFGNTLYTVLAYDIINGTIGDQYSVFNEIFFGTIINPSVSGDPLSYSWDKVTESSLATFTSIKFTYSVVSIIIDTSVVNTEKNEAMQTVVTSLIIDHSMTPPSQSSSSSIIIPITLSATIVPCFIILIICVSTFGVLLYVHWKSEKKQKQHFTMYNADIKEVQRNPAYSTIIMCSREVNSKVQTTDNPSYACV